MRVCVVGAGPAGITAANLASRIYETVLIEKKEEVSKYMKVRYQLRNDVKLMLGEEARSVTSSCYLKTTRRDEKFDYVIVCTGRRKEFIRHEQGLRNVILFDIEEGFFDRQVSGNVIIIGKTEEAASIINSFLLDANILLFSNRGFTAGIGEEELEHYVEEKLEKAGVKTFSKVPEGIVGEGKVEAVIHDGKVYRADCVIATPERKEGRNIIDGTNSRIVVDRHMGTSLKNVYAAGECCSVKRGSVQSNVLAEYASSSSGLIASLNVCGLGLTENLVNLYSIELIGYRLVTAGYNKKTSAYHGYDASYSMHECNECFFSVTFEKASRVPTGFSIFSRDEKISPVLAPLLLRERIDSLLASSLSSMRVCSHYTIGEFIVSKIMGR